MVTGEELDIQGSRVKEQDQIKYKYNGRKETQGPHKVETSTRRTQAPKTKNDNLKGSKQNPNLST